MLLKEWLKDDLSINIWKNKYRFKEENLEEWFERVSGGNEKVKQLIKDRKFLFAGRILANRGTKKQGSMMNCYSSGFVEDSLEEILKVNSELALTYKAQGGQGLSLTKIRPKGCGISNGQFKSDGIVPFMQMFNQTTSSISQGGSRKGALIMGLDIWHKEAGDFITIKSQNNSIEKANLSLEIDDDFMKIIDNYYNNETIDEEIEILRENNYGNETISYKVKPVKLYKKMIKEAYDWGEPGCIFTNQFRNYNMMEKRDDYQIELCNPLTF